MLIEQIIEFDLREPRHPSRTSNSCLNPVIFMAKQKSPKRIILK